MTFRSILEALPIGVQIWEATADPPGDIVLRWANAPSAAPAGMDEVLRRAAIDQVPADLSEPGVRVRVRPLGGRRVVVSWEEVPEAHEHERALAASERMSASIVSNLQEGIVVVDAGGRITRANETAASICGVSLGELVGLTLADLDIEMRAPDGTPIAAEERPLARALAGDTVRGATLQMVRRDGSRSWVEIDASPLAEADGTPYGALSTYVDVSERIAWERRMRAEAESDPLTGLANRRALARTLETAVDRAARSEREVAVLVLDLDGFKALNDRWGHLAGDGALRSVGMRLRRCVRERDLVARLGGDEFVLVLADLPAGAGADAAAECEARVLVALSEPVRFEGGVSDLGAAIGIAVFPHDGTEPAALLRYADREMYAAKAR